VFQGENIRVTSKQIISKDEYTSKRVLFLGKPVSRASKASIASKASDENISEG
jgi:hypothetical protein